MSTFSPPKLSAERSAISALFQNKAPILVEVRFPKMGTSPDWRLCEDEREFDALLDGLGNGVEIHLTSVWEIKSDSNTLVITK